MPPAPRATAGAPTARPPHLNSVALGISNANVKAAAAQRNAAYAAALHRLPPPPSAEPHSSPLAPSTPTAMTPPAAAHTAHPGTAYYPPASTYDTYDSSEVYTTAAYPSLQHYQQMAQPLAHPSPPVTVPRVASPHTPATTVELDTPHYLQVRILPGCDRSDCYADGQSGV